MEPVIYFVYLLTFANGKAYVGMSRTDKKGRWSHRYNGHADAARKGKALPVYHAWRKHGAPVQTILSKHATREECALAEIQEIAARNATDPCYGYNLMRGGEGMHAPKGSAVHALMREKVWDNPEVREKLRAANKGKRPSAQCLAASVKARENNPEWRAKMQERVWLNAAHQAVSSERTRLQMANGGAAHMAEIRRAQGDMRTPEQVADQNARIRAYVKTPEGKAAAKSGYAAMIADPEALAKQREGQDRWRASEKNRANCLAMAKKSAESCSRKVRDVETGKSYASQREMARALGVSEALISRRVKEGKIDKV